MWLFASTVIITLHTPGNHPVHVFKDQITSLQQKRDGPNTLFVEGTECLVNLVDGKHVAVIETCLEVRRLIEGVK